VDAEGTLLYDPLKRQWDERLLGLIGLERDRLPEAVHAAQIVGRITEKGSAWSGLPAGVPVIAGTTDTLLELIASGVRKPGDCTVKLATFGRICVLSAEPYFERGLITYSYLLPDRWYPGTGTKSFASSLRWFRDNFCRDLGEGAEAFTVMEREAAGITPGSGGLLYHPYLQGEGSPYNDPRLRGDFIGLSLHHRRAHLIRAVMEGTAFSLLDSMNFIREMKIEAREPVRYIGGGTRSMLWTRIVADVLGMDGIKPGANDPSVGAALVAGLGAGVFGSLEEAQELVEGGAEPVAHDEKNTARYAELFGRYEAAVGLLTELYHGLSSFGESGA
jgi:xylulokinase